MSSVQVISDPEFETVIAQSDRPVLAYFWASWCGPCRLMGPPIEWVAATWGDRLKIVKLEVDPNPVSVKHYQVEGLPMLILFKDGQEIVRSEGAKTQAQLAEFLTPHLGPAAVPVA